ncbi:MAG: N-acetylmuramoyl-L-alanine amidase, partial [Gemmatimonadota bacterium]
PRGARGTGAAYDALLFRLAEVTRRSSPRRASRFNARRAVFAATLAAALWTPAAAAQESFTLELSGRKVEIPTRRIGGTVYVALRDLARGLGGSVEWLDVGERVAASFSSERMVFRRDLPFVEARGRLHQIPHAPRFQRGELYVPFSFIQQGLPAIFPERFEFERRTSSLRGGPPGQGPERIEYLVAPGLTTLRFFFSGVTPDVAADPSLPHTLVLRVEGASITPLEESALAGLGLVDSVRIEREASGVERLVLRLHEDAFLYQVARLEQPTGFELTLYAPASGVDAGAVLARAQTSRAGAEVPSPTGPTQRDVPGGSPGAAPSRGEGAGAQGAGDARPGDVAAGGEAGAPGVQTPLPAARPEARRPRAGIRTVVIDPGHGGRDVGAVGPSGLFEKDITLEVALALRKELEERGGMRVILTRDRDYFVPLTARTRKANEAGADLFVSIHCNSARSRTGGGFETYFLSEAKTEDERRVARMENASLRFEYPDIDPDQLGELNFILWDLAQNEYLRESSSLAALIQDGLADELDLRNRGVKQAGFWVLNGAYMPAILVETAFISNPREERLLASREFQDRLVDGLADSILEYVDLYERKVAAAEVEA